jgi:hypothetical protein
MKLRFLLCRLGIHLQSVVRTETPDNDPAIPPMHYREHRKCACGKRSDRRLCDEWDQIGGI